MPFNGSKGSTGESILSFAEGLGQLGDLVQVTGRQLFVAGASAVKMICETGGMLLDDVMLALKSRTVCLRQSLYEPLGFFFRQCIQFVDQPRYRSFVQSIFLVSLN